MGEQENNEIKILIDALKYTSNIIVDLTNKLTSQEEKITILENKINKIQKKSMENNLILKTIDIEKLNEILLLDKKNNFKNNNIVNNNDDRSDEITQYIVNKNDKNDKNNKNNKQEYTTQSNQQNKLSGIAGDKNKIDKLIGSIVKRKNDLSQLINENKEQNIHVECEYTKNDKTNKQTNGNENTCLDFTIKTATNKSNYDGTKTTYEHSGINHNKEEENITKAQNNDLDKANNILKQIRRRANIRRM